VDIAGTAGVGFDLAMGCPATLVEIAIPASLQSSRRAVCATDTNATPPLFEDPDYPPLPLYRAVARQAH
jgi:hypothetical protein